MCVYIGYKEQANIFVHDGWLYQYNKSMLHQITSSSLIYTVVSQSIKRAEKQIESKINNLTHTQEVFYS